MVATGAIRGAGGFGAGTAVDMHREVAYTAAIAEVPMRVSPWIAVFMVASLAGLAFAGASTYDFVQHLDRDVHSITCSFIPGLGEADATGSSGCHTTMMSPYSSWFRASIWGGLPVALPAMGVFAFLLFRGLDLMLNRGPDERAPRTFLAAASLLPVLTSLVFGYLSIIELDAACKLCIGIYVSSIVAFVAAVLEWRGIGRPMGADLGLQGDANPEGDDLSPARAHAFSFAQGVGFVAVPALVYVVAMPNYEKYIGACGELAKPEDPYGVLVPLDPHPGAAQTIEVFDPLCSACRGFERRLTASGLGEQLDRKVLLFPLDNTCNWMVSSAMHPGACAVSEAVLCAGDKAGAVVDWAFDNQPAILEAAGKDPTAAAKMAAQAFPELEACIGSPGVKSKLNKSLRWAVANQLPVLTPQVYVEGTKLCEEDTDLGMDYALTRLLTKRGAAVVDGEAAK